VGALRRTFLAAPLHSRGYGSGFGTVYTAIYRPAAGTVEIAWPGLAPLAGSFARFPETRRRIVFSHGLDPWQAAIPSSDRSGLENRAAP
jgi:hypothetical protein